MKTNKYLYGEGTEVEELPADIIMRRVEILEEHLKELYAVHYMDRDDERIRAVDKALKFWRTINEN